MQHTQRPRHLVPFQRTAGDGLLQYVSLEAHKIIMSPQYKLALSWIRWAELYTDEPVAGSLRDAEPPNYAQYESDIKLVETEFPAIGWDRQLSEIGGGTAVEQHTIRLLDVRLSYLYLSGQHAKTKIKLADVQTHMDTPSCNQDHMKSKMLVQYLVHSIVHEFTHWARRQYFGAPWSCTPPRIATPFAQNTEHGVSADSGTLMEVLLFGGKLSIMLPVTNTDVTQCSHAVQYHSLSFINRTTVTTHSSEPMLPEGFLRTLIGLTSILNVASIHPMEYILHSSTVSRRPYDDEVIEMYVDPLPTQDAHRP